jgi:parvulin-like peptidyl-prolyl isomerase
LLLLLVGCSNGGDAEREVLAKAWGKPLITKTNFLERLEEEAPQCVGRNSPSCDILRRNLLDLMVDEALLGALAKESGIQVDPATLKEEEEQIRADYPADEDPWKRLPSDAERWSQANRRRLQLRALLSRTLPDVEISEEEARAYYEDHRELFIRPRTVRIRQIVVADRDTAQQIRKRLKKGEDFASLASQYSLSPESVRGGDLGYLEPGQMPPELEEAAFSLEKGQLSEIISTPYGYHILRLDEVRPPREEVYEEVREEILEILLQERIRHDYRAWLKAIRKEAQVEVMTDRMEEIFGGREP